MSDTQNPEQKPDVKSGMATTADKANQVWADLVPVVGFVLVYNAMRLFAPESGLFAKSSALYWATGVLIVLTGAAIARQLIKGEKPSLFMLFSAGIVGGFGLIGILLQEEYFIYMKPTIQQLFLASLIFGSIAIGQNIWKVMFQEIFDLPDHAWRTLAMRWGGFFIAMALWNEYLWRTYAPPFDEAKYLIGNLLAAPAGSYEFLSLQFGTKDAEQVWANWKLGNMVITLIFGALNVPYMLKHLQDEDTAEQT